MAFTDDLIGYWPLDETTGNALDAHGSNDFVLTGANSSAGGRVYTNARDFSSSEYFKLADSEALSVDDEDFTVSIFAYLNSKTNDRDFVAHYDFGTNQRSWRIGYASGTDRFRFIISSDGTTSTILQADSLGIPALGKWYHVLCWHVQGENIYMRINGGATDAAGTPHTTGVQNSSGNLTISTLMNSGAPYDTTFRHDGRLNAFGFWRRVLTDAEQLKLHMHMLGGRYPFPAQPPTMVVVGDTQNLTRTAASSDKWGQWVADNTGPLNIKLVAHMGDHTEFAFAPVGSTFAKHRTSVDLFIAGVPMSLLPGNHDIDDDGLLTRAVTSMSDSAALPMSLITGKSEFDEQMNTSGYDQYVYSMFIDLGYGLEDLFIVLPFGPTIAQLNWATDKAAQYPRNRVFILTHELLHLDGSLSNEVQYPTAYLSTDAFPYVRGGGLSTSSTDGTWLENLKFIPNLVAIFCGHAISGNIRSVQTLLENDNGDDVLAVCCNIQEKDGLGGAGDGNGYVVICEMTSGGRIMTARGYLSVIDTFPTALLADSFTHTFRTIGNIHTAVPGVTHEIDHIAWSPCNGTLTVDSPAGTTIFELDVTADGLNELEFPGLLRGVEGEAMHTTLAATESLNVSTRE